MRHNIIIILLLGFLLSFSGQVMHNSYMVESKTLIVKFSESYAPKLGLESPISISDISSIDHSDNFKELLPLFTTITQYSNLHYEHNLHQYYRLELHEHNDSFTHIINDLSNLEFIENVATNGIAKTLLVPNDELYVNQWDHDNQRQAIQYGTGDLIGMIDCDLDTDLAWDITTGDPSVIIAILDTGVDLDHPDLVNNMVSGYNFVNDSLPPDDQFDHGTPCAGIAAATINNDIGIAGVCPNCSIMSVKVLNDDGSGDWGIISEGIVWASDNDADVISLSLGGGQYQEVLESAVNYSVANGSVTIAASGNINNNMDFYPASYDQCIAVGAMSPCCERKQGVNSCDAEPGWGSTYGDQIDFVAPGVRIFATAKRAGYWTDFNGTSSACPHVAGIAGLMLSKNPYLNPETVREMLRQSADDIGDPGYDIETGYGKVNAYESILLVPSPVSGDINLDGTVNISDVVILVDEILFGSYITSGDINADGINNINDIMLLIQIILI